MSLTVSPPRIVKESRSPLLAAPDSWPRRPLGDVATILNGFAFKSKQFVREGGKPLIRIRDIFSDRTAVGYGGEYDARYLVRPGELLVGMDGDFNCARWRGPEGLLNQRVCKITPQSDQLDLDFLTHVLPGYLQAIHDVTSSTTVTHLSSRDVAQIPIPVPTLTEQQKLAELFGRVESKQDSSSAHLRATRRTIERFRQAVLAAACSGRLTADWRDTHPDVRPVEQALAELPSKNRRPSPDDDLSDLLLPDLPDSYILSTVSQASLVLEYGTSKRADAASGARVAILRMGNIQDAQLELDDLKYISVDREIEHLMLKDGDLLFNRTNSPELVGKSAVFHGRTPMTFASYLIRVRFGSEVAEPDFVNFWINSAWGKAWARQVKTDGVSQSNINGTKLGAMPVPLPPIEEQREIVHRASLMLQLADGLLNRVDAATRQVDRSLQSILVKAFRGELTSAEIQPAHNSLPSISRGQIR